MQLIKTLTSLILLAALSPLHALPLAEGGNSSGGGGPDTVSAGALRVMIESGSLKRAMRNYLNTINVRRIEDQAVQLKLSELMATNPDETVPALVLDLERSVYFVADGNQKCRDQFNNDRPASAKIGQRGTPICFDITKLVEDYKSLNEEEAMIRLAALAFHEHVHHFQKVPNSLAEIQQTEAIADRVGGYVQLTAKIVQVPLLEWSQAKDNEQAFNEIQKLFETIRAKERIFLRPKPEDYAGYSDYREKADRGVFRILPREKYDGKMSIDGGGSYYSFSNQAHSFQSTPQLGLEQNEFKVGFGGCDYGYLVELGDIPLENVDLKHPAVAFMSGITIPKGEPAIRKVQYETYEGPIVNGLNYARIRKKPRIGQTYAVRAISFREADVLATFKVLRRLKDGSYILAWKMLKTFPVRECE